MHMYGRNMDETRRRQLMNPEAVLAALRLRPGHIFVDVGCGDGFFALPAARTVGPEGKVYGLDTDSAQIDEFRRKAAEEGLDNVDLKVGKAEETVFCQKCADVVFFGNVLHDFEDPAKVVRNAGLMLKATGMLGDFDWKRIATDFGPPLSIRLDEGAARRLIESNGFGVTDVQAFEPYHYLIIADLA
jgi:ubiquinone/menaquinone biosynthesis C-methylase UbiE